MAKWMDGMNTEYIWSQKYRPSSLDNFIGNDHLKSKLASYIKEQQIPNLLFYGIQGSGKTSAAKILIKEIDCDYLFLNGSDTNDIETVRTKIKGFASSIGFKPIKIVVYDEADFLSQASQSALRATMEIFSKTTRFIFTANYKERLIEPLISRCQTFEMSPPSKKDVALHLTTILDTEKVKYNPEMVAELVHAYYPDIRHIINSAQLHNHDGKLDLKKQELIASDYKTAILEELKSKKKDKFTSIRQIMADSKIKDFTPLYTFLYERVLEYAGDNVSEVIKVIAEGQYKESLVVDKEIQASATILNIVERI